jgi:hypothetical protein
MIPIEIPYREVKGKRIKYEWNGFLLMARLLIVDDDDNIVKGWEFRFKEV